MVPLRHDALRAPARDAVSSRFLIALLLSCACARAELPPGTPPRVEAEAAPSTAPLASSPLRDRIPPPQGFARLAVAEGSFGAWLRELSIKPGRPPVLLWDGRPKGNQQAHFAVVDMDVGARDLQQCADAIMRLRAEYLYAGPCADEIRFDFTSGDTVRWSQWRQGTRPQVSGNKVLFSRTAESDPSYANFRRYLDSIFTYAGTLSLSRELSPVPDPLRIEPGDIYIHGGSPGHAVIVVDVAEDSSGARIFLLAQGYMPAQEIHVLRSFDPLSPWHRALAEGNLVTPEWTFAARDLMRFPKTACEGP